RSDRRSVIAKELTVKIRQLFTSLFRSISKPAFLCHFHSGAFRKGVDKKCPNSILLLYDAYGHADAQDAMAAFRRIKGSDWFHSVFWVMPTWTLPGCESERPRRRGLFLSTRRRDWVAERFDQSVGDA
ncbi:MAG: hypothetical protein WC551_14380, partial [Patescibacteria group bacterium]